MKFIEILPYFIAVLPALIFYLAYWQYFVFEPDIRSHLAAFSSGALAAAIIAFIRLKFGDSDQNFSLAFEAFILAALPEKLAILIIILLILRTNPVIPVEVVVGACIAGLGFAVVENILYAAEFGGMMIARSIAVTPLHITSSGLMGYYVAMVRMKKFHPIYGVSMAILISAGLHGFYDLALLSGKSQAFWALIPLIIAIGILDYRMAQTRNIPPSDILNALSITLRGWYINQRQFQYERWILREKADFNPDYEPLFHWRMHRFRIILGILLLIAPAWYFQSKARALSFLNPDTVLAILVFLPVALIIILLAVGIFNPEYFKHGIIRVPAMMQVHFLEGCNDKSVVAYDIRSHGCFLKTASALKEKQELLIQFEFGNFKSGPIRCTVIQQNHKNIQLPLGSLLEFHNKSLRFQIFLMRNVLFRIKSGLKLLLKLPGHSLIRRLFITPESVAKDLRFFPSGTQILREGMRGQEFFLIRQGEVEIFKTSNEGVETVLARLGPGQIVGEMAIAGNVPRNASARCIHDSILSFADGNDLNSLVRQNPDFARQLLATIAARAFVSGETLEDRLDDLEKSAQINETALRNVLLLALLGGQGNSLEKNTLDAVLINSWYKKLGINHHEVKTLLATAATGQPLNPEPALKEILGNLKLNLRLSKVPASKPKSYPQNHTTQN